MDTQTILLAVVAAETLLIILLLFQRTGALPMPMVMAMLDYLDGRAAETPTKTDDEAVALLREILNAVQPDDAQSDSFAGKAATPRGD